jgi:hypothetical protein
VILLALFRIYGVKWRKLEDNALEIGTVIVVSYELFLAMEWFYKSIGHWAHFSCYRDICNLMQILLNLGYYGVFYLYNAHELFDKDFNWVNYVFVEDFFPIFTTVCIIFELTFMFVDSDYVSFSDLTLLGKYC